MKQFSINGLTLTQEDKLVLFWFKYVEETSSPTIYQSSSLRRKMPELECKITKGLIMKLR